MHNECKWSMSSIRKMGVSKNIRNNSTHTRSLDNRKMMWKSWDELTMRNRGITWREKAGRQIRSHYELSDFLIFQENLLTLPKTNKWNLKRFSLSKAGTAPFLRGPRGPRVPAVDFRRVQRKQCCPSRILPTPLWIATTYHRACSQLPKKKKKLPKSFW